MSGKFAVFYLIVVAGLWGLTFPLIETSMQIQDPFLFVAMRFSLASMVLLPYFLKNRAKEVLVAGAILGLLNSAAYVTQTIGLQTVNASRAAFLTGMNVIFIPFIAPFFKLQLPTRYDVLSAIVCCLGVYILTGCDMSQLTLGDGWVIACAFSVALSIAYIGYLAAHDCNPYALTASQIVMTAICTWVLCFFFADFSQFSFDTSTVATLVYCSFFATILTLGLQAKYQKYVSAQKTGLIFCLEPVFAAFFDVCINDASLQLNTLVGGGCILSSIVMLELSSNKKPAEADVKTIPSSEG